MKYGFKSVAVSDVGLQRDGNEDSAFISPVLVAVADGMGGHAAGEVASKIAIDALAGIAGVLSDSEIDLDSREDLLLNITKEIDDEFSKISRPLGKYVYVTLLDKQLKSVLERLVERPSKVVGIESIESIKTILESCMKEQ